MTTTNLPLINTVFELYDNTLKKLFKVNRRLYYDLVSLRDKTIDEQDITIIKRLLYRFELSTWTKDKCYRDLWDVAVPQYVVLASLQQRIKDVSVVETMRPATPEFKF